MPFNLPLTTTGTNTIAAMETTAMIIHSIDKSAGDCDSSPDVGVGELRGGVVSFGVGVVVLVGLGEGVGVELVEVDVLVVVVGVGVEVDVGVGVGVGAGG